MIVYEVNKEKHCVVARFKEHNWEGKWYWRNCLIKMCDGILNPTYTQAPTYEIIDKILDSYVDDSFIAKSVCCKEDEWDEEKGKQVAKAKLLKKWNRAKQAVLWSLSDFIVDNYTDTMRRLNKKLLK